MPERVRRKWRPPLALVVGGTLAGVLFVPLIGIAYFRVAGNILGWAETSWMIFWLAVISTALLGFLLWRLVLRPVYALTSYARAVKAGRADAVQPHHFGTPEFGDLGQSVIDMGETLNNRARGMRAYAAHVTHELKSPLTAIAGAAELLEEADSPEDRMALARSISEAAARMQLLLGDLRRHAAASEGSGPGRSDLAEVAGGIGGLRVEVVRGGSLPIPPDDLEAVLTQLAQNAAMHGADTLRLDWAEGRLSVQDNGNGVAEGNRDRLFDPFFTTTRDQGGTGMGLSIVQSLLAAHGGQIAHVPTEKGARFDIVF